MKGGGIIPYLEQINYQGNLFFAAEGRIAGRDNPVKIKPTSDGLTAVAFTLNVGYAKMIDPNGTIEDENGQRYAHSMQNIYCKIYPSSDNTNRWQIEEAQSLRYREHVIIFGKVYTTKKTDADGEEVPFTEYRIDSILFPERLASMQANGNVIDLSAIKVPEYVPNGAGGVKVKPSGEKSGIPEAGEEWF